MSQPWSLALVQMDALVGDIEGNAAKILAMSREASAAGADIAVFPELALIGYPPEDLLLRPSLEGRIQAALALLAAAPIKLILGYPGRRQERLYNLAGVWEAGVCLAEYRKACLPNYQVFDERRYFSAGSEPCVIEHRGQRLGLLICEDVWHTQPVQASVAAGAEVLVCLNASPYHRGKQAQRERILKQRSQESGCSLLYVNMVGGQDELVFDGASCVIDADARLVARAPQFREQLLLVDVPVGRPQACAELLDPLAEVYAALVLAVRDYVDKNAFPGVVLGLSGGIDSALTLAIAVDALGPERVRAVMMPYHYTAAISCEDAEQQARTLGVTYHCYPIIDVVQALQRVLQAEQPGPSGPTLENLQARARGTLLMALSNQHGSLVLTTGNKSEMSVGYATLYGDMAGGFDVLKDVPKTLVFALARHRNQRSPVIPQRVIDRPPSAELAPDQKDQDSLPPYDILDEILRLYIEEDASAEAIIAAGFERACVYEVLRKVDRNEYKRRQAAIGPRLSERGLGKDRRYPITQAWRPGD